MGTNSIQQAKNSFVETSSCLALEGGVAIAGFEKAAASIRCRKAPRRWSMMVVTCPSSPLYCMVFSATFVRQRQQRREEDRQGKDTHSLSLKRHPSRIGPVLLSIHTAAVLPVPRSPVTALVYYVQTTVSVRDQTCG